VTADWWLGRWSGTVSAWLALLICGGIAALAWFGYRAADEWQRSAVLLVDRRANEVVDMLATGLTRDMRAVQTTVLDGREWNETLSSSPYEAIDTVAAAFARYPYPEVFFGWQTEAPAQVFFARSDRMPSWLASTGGGRQYPVEVLVNERIARQLLQRIARDVTSRRPHSIFEINLDGTHYQVVARPTYSSMDRGGETGGFAFLVNMEWVQRNYFAAITGQVARIAGAGDELVTTILDEHGVVVPGLPPPPSGGPVTRRLFPLTFFDPTLTDLDPPSDLQRRRWAVQVNAATDPTLALAARASRRTLVVIAAGAVALAIGLFVTARAAQAMATVSEMRSDFVATVTHELKTPVQVIRSIGETISRGRVSTPERLLEYAQLLVQESHRLSRLIDNLLAYSRVTDVAQLYSFAPQPPHDIVAEALRGFHRLVVDRGFELIVDVPETLPAVRADRTSVVLALDNLIDNAMRYSGDARRIEISGRVCDSLVALAVRDYGVGIDADELGRVPRRFARGRSAAGHGSGLGLAIVNRIARDHGGGLHLDSLKHTGTVATLSLPIAN
jgi:signal transduction histidine kinase